jgi:hypothetical protein
MYEPMTNEEYANTAGPICPFCRSTNKDGQDDVEWCNDCGAEWEEQVRVVGYDIITEPDGGDNASEED